MQKTSNLPMIKYGSLLGRPKFNKMSNVLWSLGVRSIKSKLLMISQRSSNVDVLMNRSSDFNDRMLPCDFTVFSLACLIH